MRLAERLGRTDPDRLYEQLDDETFAEWCALAILDDWSGWQKVGTICAAVHNSALQMAASNGAKVKESDFRTASDYMPGDGNTKLPQPAEEAAFVGLKAALGL